MIQPAQHLPAGDRQLPWRVLVPAAAAVIVVVALLAVAFYRRHYPPMDDYGRVPDVSMVDQRGRRISSASALGGHATIVNFIFTRCPLICPTITAQMSRIQSDTSELGTALQFLSISVDPDYDTPEVLETFAARFSADPVRWTFATGDRTAIEKAITDGYMIAVERRGSLASGAPDIAHGSHFVLVDRDLTIRGYYDSNSDERMSDLLRDARRLAR